MVAWVILFIAFSAFFVVLRVKHRKKLEAELDQKIAGFQEQLFTFTVELKSLLTHYVEKEEETAFLEKWNNLYKEIFRYCHLKKLNDYIDSSKFLAEYRSIPKQILTSNIEIRRRESIEAKMPRVAEFFEELSELSKQYVTHYDEIRFTQKWQGFDEDLAKIDIRREDDEYESFESLKAICGSLHNHFQRSNAIFIQKESKRCDEMLSNIDGKSLDMQQRTAVINDEDRILVLAGAGSGKTLTIAAKVKYLCEQKSVEPKDILLLSFTKKSAKEMTDRIQGKLGIQVEASTFHKLGLDIIKLADGARPEVSDENELGSFVHDFFENELINYPDLIKSLTEYFAYYLEIPEDAEKYQSIGDLYETEKNADLETIKSRYEQEKYIRETGANRAETLTTLNNEKVKSL